MAEGDLLQVVSNLREDVNLEYLTSLSDLHLSNRVLTIKFRFGVVRKFVASLLVFYFLCEFKNKIVHPLNSPWALWACRELTRTRNWWVRACHYEMPLVDGI